MSKTAHLDKVLPENIQVSATSARQSLAGISNVSTVEVVPNKPFDAGAYESGYQASAAANSEHLNLTTQIATLREPLAQLKHQFSESATILKQIQHQDTRVNIVRDKRIFKIDIPGDLKAYANDLNQPEYLQVMITFLDRDRVRRLKDCVIRSGQIDRPALWLNQQIFMETKMPYAFTLDREITPEIKDELAVHQANEAKAKPYFEWAFGPDLYAGLSHISDVTKLNMYTVFVMLVDKVLGLHVELQKVSPIVTLWETALEEK